MKHSLFKLIFVVCCLAVTNFAAADQKFTVGDVKGGYGFSFKGEIIGVGPIVATGAFKSDGKGNITEAVRTLNFLGAASSQTFTCSYTVNPDGTGSAVCPLDNPLPGFPEVETFDYVLENVGKAFRLVGTTPGVVVLGGGHRQ